MHYDQTSLREKVHSRMRGCEDQPTPRLVREYAESHDLTMKTRKWLKVIFIRFGAFVGHDPVDGDFTPATVNAWLTAMLDEERLSRVTVKSYRRGLLILWRWLHDEDRAPSPIKVKRIKAPWPVPRGFFPQEVTILIEEAKKMPGRYRRSHVERGMFMAAFLRTAYNTGLRPCDLWRLKIGDFNKEGKGGIVQEKTGTTIRLDLWPETLAAIRAILPASREFIFGEVVSKKSFYKALRRLVEAAGLERGAIYKIRKGAASALERDHPGFGARFLGHKTPGLAERHYFDPRIVNADRPLPPALPPALPGQEGGPSDAT